MSDNLTKVDVDNLPLHIQKVIEKFYKIPMPANDTGVSIPISGLKKLTHKPSKRVNKRDRERIREYISSRTFKEISVENCNSLLSNSEACVGESESLNIARRTHGTMHIVRTSLFSILVLSIIEKFYLWEKAGVSKPSPQHFINIPLLTTLHDSARQRGGIDFWDELSGEIAVKYFDNFISSPYSPEEIIKATVEKDNEQKDTLEQIVIHDADCLDIMRTRGDFESGRLEIIKLADSSLKEEISEVLNEVNYFITVTEYERVKQAIEQSKNAYQDMLNFLVKEDTQKKFPKITSYILQHIPTPEAITNSTLEKAFKKSLNLYRSGACEIC